MSEVESPKSPCISICVLDEEDICTGCFRSAQEITDWTMSSDAKKREVNARARQRMLDANPIRLG